MIKIIVSSDSRYNIDKLAVQAVVLNILKRQRVKGNIEISISIVGDRKMHEINKKFRGIDNTANILSFALEDPISQSSLQHMPKVGFVKSPDNVLRLGDIVLSYPELIKDAASEGVSIDEQMRFLMDHGVKHLLGTHHD